VKPGVSAPFSSEKAGPQLAHKSWQKLPNRTLPLSDSSAFNGPPRQFGLSKVSKMKTKRSLPG
jgi:hypothetical protein